MLHEIDRLRSRLFRAVKRAIQVPWKVSVFIDTGKRLDSATLPSNTQFLSAVDWVFISKDGKTISIPKELAARSYVEMEQVP